MKMMKIFNREDWKRSRKIKALEKVLDKLEKKKKKIEEELDSEGFGQEEKETRDQAQDQ